MIATTLVTVDFRAPGVANRFRCLEGIADTVHIALEPSRREVPDVNAYAGAMLDAAHARLSGRVIVVTYCVASGLAGPICAAIAARGGVVERVVQVDPVRADEGRVIAAYGDVTRQLVENEPDCPALGPLLAHGFDTAVKEMVHPVSAMVYAALGLDESDMDDPDETAVELIDRYRCWLQHVLACHAGSSDVVTFPVSSVNLEDEDFARLRDVMGDLMRG